MAQAPPMLGQEVPTALQPRDESGLLIPGNIDLTNRPRVQNADGSISTVRSMSFEQDGKEVLIPTVVGGKVVSDDEAIANYKKTGQHLGIFSSPAAATTFAQQLHEREADKLAPPPLGGEVPADLHPADFSSSNIKDESGEATVDPNSVGTLLTHIGAQINPIAMVRTIGKALIPEAGARLINKADQAIFGSAPISDEEAATYGPINTLKGIGAAQGAVFDKAKAAYEKGDYGTAARHFVDYLMPIAGPGVDKSSDLFQAGKWAAGGGDALGIGLAMFGPQAVARALPVKGGPLLTNPNPTEAAAVQFGRDRGIPVDAGTATGNQALKGVQQMADRSLGGSLVAQRAGRTTAAALERVGGELAQDARGAAVAPEQAGQSIRDALVSKVEAHGAMTDASYEKLRAMEADPSNRIHMPLPKQPVDLLPPVIKMQLRRIVHEMDASGYTPGKLVADEPGVGSGTTYIHRTGGAAVYDDITELLGHTPTRDSIQTEIEDYLGGAGKETAAVKAALAVARERYKGGRVSTPELPISAGHDLTRLEKTRVTYEEMGLPVDTTAAKQALKPLYEQMKRQMSVTQQDANPGLKAIGNILEGPDYAPLSQVDRDLSAIKSIARKQGGLAKFAVGKLDAAVRTAVANGGEEATRALETGRQSHIGKVKTQELIDALPGGKLEEPLAVFKRATAPGDSGIEFLRAVKEHAPQTLPQIARAKLDELLSIATERGGFDRTDKVYAEWQKLGTETKKLLFPKAGAAQQLDHFFLLAKKLNESMNPSGTGQSVMRLAEGGTLVTSPLAFIASEIGASGLSAILHSPKGVPLLTRAVSIGLRPSMATAAAKAATLADLVQAARAAGYPMALPQAAGAEPRR